MSNELTSIRFTTLNQMREGDLLIIFYKMYNNRAYPEYKNKTQLVNMIIILLEDAGNKLAGQTLPADINAIDNLELK